LKRFRPILAFVLLVNWNLHARQQKWAVLPTSQSDGVARLCSRSELPKVDGGWEPTTADIDSIEKQLSKVSYLRGKLKGSPTRSSDPSYYYRQYVGVVVARQKLIYINAFCEEHPPSYWQQRLVDVCDGGCNWGVLFDPATGEFSRFGSNAIA